VLLVVVPEGVLVVAGVEVVSVGVVPVEVGVLVVWVAVVAVVCVAVAWVAVVWVAVVCVVAVEVVVQSCRARWSSVPTESPRLERSVWLTVVDRFWTSVLNVPTALEAPVQSPDEIAELTWSRSFWSAAAWPPSSRPELLPQATRSDTAKPRPQAKTARGR
jgi:hypothetical protein